MVAQPPGSTLTISQFDTTPATRAGLWSVPSRILAVKPRLVLPSRLLPTRGWARWRGRRRRRGEVLLRGRWRRRRSKMLRRRRGRRRWSKVLLRNRCGWRSRKARRLLSRLWTALLEGRPALLNRAVFELRPIFRRRVVLHRRPILHLWPVLHRRPRRINTPRLSCKLRSVGKLSR